MSVEQNAIALLQKEKQLALDTQIFTYGYEVWVPQNGVHMNAGLGAGAGSDLPWPGAPVPPLYPGDTAVYDNGAGHLPYHIGQAKLNFYIIEDADFIIGSVSMVAYGVAEWVSGLTFQKQPGIKSALDASDTFFPLPGQNKPYVDRGVSVNIIDASSVNKNLTNTFTPIENLFTPGYGSNYPCASPFLAGYVLPKRHRLEFTFNNRDFADREPNGQSGADGFHIVKVAIHGRKVFTD